MQQKPPLSAVELIAPQTPNWIGGPRRGLPGRGREDGERQRREVIGGKVREGKWRNGRGIGNTEGNEGVYLHFTPTMQNPRTACENFAVALITLRKILDQCCVNSVCHSSLRMRKPDVMDEFIYLFILFYFIYLFESGNTSH